jgi:hypothetical protein
MTTVNGFQNHETWMIGLWIDSDRLTQLTVKQICIGSSLYDASEKLEQLIKAYVLTDNLTVWQSDLIASTLSEVNWRQLAEHFRTE